MTRKARIDAPDTLYPKIVRGVDWQPEIYNFMDVPKIPILSELKII